MTYEDPFNGGVGSPDTTTGFVLQYDGGVLISDPSGNSFYDEGLTLTPSETNLPNNLQWTPSASLFAFENCTVAYEGTTYDQGVADGDCQTGSSGPGYSCSRCTIGFTCESNL